VTPKHSKLADELIAWSFERDKNQISFMRAMSQHSKPCDESMEFSFKRTKMRLAS
jgi:hypothetical protein